MIVRNEDAVLERKLRNLLELDYPATKCQIVIVSDGSTDATESILHEQACNSRVQIMLNQLPGAKPWDSNAALSMVTGDIVIFYGCPARDRAGRDPFVAGEFRRS